MTADKLYITDVTLRDGLQMEASVIPLESKFALFHLLKAFRPNRLELTSFVHPKWIPQLADSQALCEKVFSEPWDAGIEAMAFIPNEKGLDRLLEHPIPWASAFVATSETFNQKNVNRSVSDTLLGLKKMVDRVRTQKRKIRIYVSTVFGCPYEEDLSYAQTLSVLKSVADLAPDEIALSDTIGTGVPSKVREIVSGFAPFYPVQQMALHLHNTYGMALANAQAGWELGIRSFDGSTGGVGGCPYAKGASGNVATEELLYFFHRQGHSGSVNAPALEKGLRFLRESLGLRLHSHWYDIIEKGGTIYGF